MDKYAQGKKLFAAFKKDKEIKGCPIYNTSTGTKYYVWETEEDDSVRSSHADRNGLIFDWDNPPEGGHPGEDYNCRCTAKPHYLSENESDADTKNSCKINALKTTRDEQQQEQEKELKKKEKSEYGDGTERMLLEYVERETEIPKFLPQTTGAVLDFIKNREDMKKENIKKSDKFFHCKTNYDATSRGLFGYLSALGLSEIREISDKILKGDSNEEINADHFANRMGREGARQGKTLLESCPPHPKYYPSHLKKR